MFERIILSVFLLSALGQAAPIGQTGLIESKLSYNLDTLSESGSNFIHQERVAWGVKGSSKSLLNLNYNLTVGGVLRGNTSYSNTQITPEYGVQTSFQPTRSLDVALFSYSRLRNPMQVYSDSLEYKEFVHGLKLGAQLSARTRFDISTGLRSRDINHRDSTQTSQQFVQVHLDQRLAGMQFRMTGETDIWAIDTLDKRQNTNASIQWYGSPFKALRWTANNSFYLTDDYNFWRISHRVNYDLSQRQKLWAIYSQGDFSYGSQTLLRQNHDLRYRFQWKPAFGIDLAFKGNRVSIPDSLDIFHWRSYGISAHWQAGNKGFFRGNMDAGFKESFRFGKGIDVLLSTSESKQLFTSRLMNLQIRDDLSSEFFQRLDESADPRYDIRHKLKLTTAFLPGKRYQVGNHIKVHNHFGSDLDFSPDTLRNAIIDELYFRTIKQNSQLSFFYRTVFDILDPENDLRFYFNTRFYRRISQNLSCNFISMYRFQSDIYSDYLWLNAALKYRSDLFSYTIEFQSTGAPGNIFEQDSQILLRFVRRI